MVKALADQGFGMESGAALVAVVVRKNLDRAFVSVRIDRAIHATHSALADPMYDLVAADL